MGDKAKEANEHANKALDDSRAAIEQAKNAKDTASQTDTLAQGARRDIDLIGKDIASVRKQAATLEGKLEQAKAEERQLAKAIKAITPRDIDFDTFRRELRPFVGSRFIIRCNGEFVCSENTEPDHFAEVLGLGLRLAGWTQAKSIQPTGRVRGNMLIDSGVTLGCRVSPYSSDPDVEPCRQASLALVDTLNSAEISAVEADVFDMSLPEGLILIDVWVIPTPDRASAIREVWLQRRSRRLVK